jgi:hypothetical protein
LLLRGWSTLWFWWVKLFVRSFFFKLMSLVWFIINQSLADIESFVIFLAFWCFKLSIFIWGLRFCATYLIFWFIDILLDGFWDNCILFIDF